MDENTLKTIFWLNGNRSRRSGIDRRRFSYSAHIPERRWGQDRRNDFILRMHKELGNQEPNKAVLT
jgi:hypothetical protein